MKPEFTEEVRQSDRAFQQEVWLLGQPPLGEYLDFVKDMVVNGDEMEPALLADEWRQANDHYHELEQREYGIADHVECRDLDPNLEPLAAAVEADPCFRFTFDTLPTEFGMVELDRLVVFQKSVTLDFLQTIQARIGPNPTPQSLFNVCLPLDGDNSPVHARRVGSSRFVFRSDSTDFRFHEPVLLSPEQLRNYQTFGPVAGVVGLVVGFGANLLNVIRVGKRLLLHNGYHRACALRARGVTHVPCVIQTVSRHDELELIVKGSVAETPEFYFKSARPPLLKDFFDPKLRKVLPVHRQERMIEVEFEIKDYMVRA